MRYKTKAICEGAIMVALALVLDYVKNMLPGQLPNGGSLLNVSMVPIVFYAVRYGAGFGGIAGFVFGGLSYILGLDSHAIDWTTIICDYFLAFAMLGIGAGVFKGKKWSAIWGSILGGGLQFLSSYLVGVFVWGKWMPDTFMGMTMTTPWFYSFLYNITWAAPNIALSVFLFYLFYRMKPMEKYLLRRDLQ